MKNKLLRITTVPISLDKLLEKEFFLMDLQYEVTSGSGDEPKIIPVAKKLNVLLFYNWRENVGSQMIIILP